MDNKRILEIGLAKLARNDFKDEIRSFTNCLCKLGMFSTLITKRYNSTQCGWGKPIHGCQRDSEWNQHPNVQTKNRSAWVEQVKNNKWNIEVYIQWTETTIQGKTWIRFGRVKKVLTCRLYVCKPTIWKFSKPEQKFPVWYIWKRWAKKTRKARILSGKRTYYFSKFSTKSEWPRNSIWVK